MRTRGGLSLLVVLLAAVRPAAAAVELALGGPGLFPAANATAVCPDTPLRLSFRSAPTLGSAGLIRILDVATHAIVETIDVRSKTAVKTIGGISGFNYYPVIIVGREADIYPRNGVLAYNRAYEVTIDSGVFKEGPHDYPGFDTTTAWRFTTKTAAPAAGTAKLTVAADGTGDFCTVQGALDFVPDGNTSPVTLFVRRGIYTEIVAFANKHAITLEGEDRRKTVIAYANNAKFNDGGGNPFGGAAPNPSGEARAGGHIYHRGVFLAHQARNLAMANLTVRNTTPQGGSQSEAIILNGTPAAQAVLRDVDLYSYQDTLQINGQAYLHNCTIEGDVDFMWGTGPCFFADCTARSVRSNAYYTQIRNPGATHGFVYVRCRFEGAPGVTGNFLSRIGTGRFPHSEVVLIDCVLTPAVGPVAWLFQGGREGDPHDAAEVHFWEFNSRGPDGRPVDVSGRLAGSRQLKQPDDAATIADYRDPRFVLGGDWDPK